MDLSALFDMTYGLFLLGSMNGDQPTGCIVNTVFQVTSQPPVFAISVNHSNFTNECIKKSGACSVSILSETTKKETIGTFGFHSGRDTDKFNTVKYEMTPNSLPVLAEDICGYLELKVTDMVELSTHTLFLSELIGAKRYAAGGIPMTYSYYHKVIKGNAPKAAPIFHGEEETNMSQEIYKCSVCGYVYDGSEGPFEDLPDDWKCPVCGAGKSAFKKISA